MENGSMLGEISRQIAVVTSATLVVVAEITLCIAAEETVSRSRLIAVVDPS